MLSGEYNERLIVESEGLRERYRNMRIKQLIKQGMRDRLRRDVKVQADENIVEMNQFAPEA